MVDKSVEEKVKVDGFLDLLKAPENSWVEINGNDEFKISRKSLRTVNTLCLEGEYICKKHYYLNPTLYADYIEKFSINRTVDGEKYFKLMNGSKL